MTFYDAYGFVGRDADHYSRTFLVPINVIYHSNFLGFPCDLNISCKKVKGPPPMRASHN